MDQLRIGKFIAERRKMNNLTQAQLAEKLNITDRAVSKWETGKSIPDTAIMLDLCDILKISVNDLLNGEIVTMAEYNKKTEQLLFDMAKQKEDSDKRLLRMEVLIGVLSMIILFALTIVASLVMMEDWLRILLIIIGTVPILIACPFMLRIEQTAGYYKCDKCGCRYVPSYKSVFIAPHINRTRYMKCPECGKKSWNKKVLTKE